MKAPVSEALLLLIFITSCLESGPIQEDLLNKELAYLINSNIFVEKKKKRIPYVQSNIHINVASSNWKSHTCENAKDSQYGFV